MSVLSASRSALTALLVLLFAASSGGQTPYGRITGRVTDTAAAVVPSARVQAIQVDTGVVTSTLSNSEGSFELLNLNPGRYRITVEFTGFKRYERGPLEVRVGDALPVSVVLEVGDVTENVTVTAEAPMLETASAGVGQVIDGRRVMDMPIPSGSPTYLMQLAPTVVFVSPVNHAWVPNARGVQADMTAGGTRARSSEFAMDGVANTARGGELAIPPPRESVQEFKVEVAPYDASVGFFSGAYVNMVMKSGTNDFHGTATYTHTSTPLTTKPFFVNRSLYDLSTGPVTTEKEKRLWPYTRTNFFRGSGGGPVLIPGLYNGRNRTFWHFGAQFMRNTEPLNGLWTVPTVKQRMGDFSDLLKLGANYQIYDPATTTPAANGLFRRQPFPGNIIPMDRISPVALKFLAFYPLPNASGNAEGRQNYTGAPPLWTNFDTQLIRIDHVVADNHRLYGTLNLGQQDAITNQILPGARGMSYPQHYWNLALDDVIALRPDLVANVRYGLRRAVQVGEPSTTGFDLSTLGLSPALTSGVDKRYTALPRTNITGYEPLGDANATRFGLAFHTIAANVTNIRGNHAIKLGGEARIYQYNLLNYANVSPNYTFDTGWTRGPLNTSGASPIGQGLASFLLGLPTSGFIDRPSSLAETSKSFAWFIHDDWKVTPRLTFNVGLRYEIEFPITERYNRANRGFDFDATNPIQDAARAAYAANSIPEVPVSAFQTRGGLLFAGVGGQPRGIWDADKNNFAPRVGLSWQVADKTVLRAGYGIYYGTQGADRSQVDQLGFSERTSLVASVDNGQTFQADIGNPFPTGVREPIGAEGGLRTYLGRSVAFFAPWRTNSYMQRWSFNIQQELPHRVLIELGYLGNRGNSLPVTRDLNAVPAQYLSTSPTRDQAAINYLSAAVNNPFSGLPEFAGSDLQGRTVARSQLLKPYPHFSGLATSVPDGFSWYHAGTLRVEKRFAQGYSLQGSYTWSKFMEAVEMLNASDLHPHHVISPQDRPHVLAISGIYDFPIGKGRPLGAGMPRWAHHIAGDWSLQAMYMARSGPPIEWGNVAFYGDIHDIVLPKGERTVERWFNTDAGFERASTQQLGSNIRTFPLRLTGLRAGGVNNWNISLLKNIRLMERVSLQLRADSTNAFNHANFNPPSTTPTNSLFGQVTGTSGADQRKIVVAAQLIW